MSKYYVISTLNFWGPGHVRIARVPERSSNQRVKPKNVSKQPTRHPGLRVTKVGKKVQKLPKRPKVLRFPLSTYREKYYGPGMVRGTMGFILFDNSVTLD